MSEQSKESNVIRSFYIAGVRHHQMKDALGYLSENNILKLEPEPTNPYDPNAVKIIYETFEKRFMLGYVPAKFSSEISALIETEVPLECEIVELNPSAKPWEMCKVAIKRKED